MPENRKKISAKRRKPGRRDHSRAASAASPGWIWLYGRHAVLAALANPRRTVRRVLAADGPETLPERARDVAETADRRAFEAALGPGAVHQGLAAEVTRLPPSAIEDVIGAPDEAGPALLVALDQVTDPQNIGAVLRSAAVFGARAVIVPDRNAPEETGALAKAASGALETVPLVRATNLVRALETAKQGGFWCVGLDAAAETAIGAADIGARRLLVLGAEGRGLRRLTRETCDLLVRIDGAGDMDSLNVSNAAAVALYALSRPGR